MQKDNLYAQAKQRVESLFHFVDNSPTAFHAALNEAKFLEKHGFKELDWQADWDFQANDKYYLIVGGRTLIAFIVGTEKDKGFRLIGTHNDSPALRVKNNPEIKSEGFKQINVEPYGGLVYRGWFDRPLAVAGRLLIKKDQETIVSKIINIEENALIIPSLAIHMNRKMNSEGKIDPQKELCPVYALDNEGTPDFLDYVAAKSEVKREDILDFDLFLIPNEKGAFVGTENEFYSLPRLDNLLMTHQAVTAIAETSETENAFTRVVISTDNEEVGSATGRGADSNLLVNCLRRIAIAQGISEEEYLQSLARSFFISTDVSHAAHPNYPEVADPTNRPRLNQGPVLKVAANKSYNTVGASAARFRLYAENANAPVQTFFNKSGKPGGSTIGPLAEKWTTIPGVDIGIPILSMHNIRELGGVLDHEYSIKIMSEFLESEY